MVGAVQTRSRTVPFEVTNPELIPAKRYYDEEFYKLECERLWPHVWQMACRLEQIPNIGDWVEYTIVGKSVVVVRTRDGVKAFHNACRHRGVKLAEGHGNCTRQGFICPFHGWRWDMDGRNTFVYGRQLFSEQVLDAGQIALKPCRVELWGGCAFINFDDQARPFRECLGGLADRLEAHGVDRLRAEWWFATVIPSNWKTAMEAFQEGYHVLRTHPQLPTAAASIYQQRYESDLPGKPQSANPIATARATARENVRAHFRHMEQLHEGMSGLVHAKELAIARSLLDMELPDDPVEAVKVFYGRLNHEITVQGRARGEPTPDLNAVAVSHPVNALEFIFPHFFLLTFFASMSSYRIRPLGPESCLFELWSLTAFPAGQEPPPPMAPVILPYDSDKFPPIPRQDYSNIPLQQLGLHAEGFEDMRLSKDVEGLISNYHRLIDGYLRGTSPERLGKAMTAICGGFDGPIVDIGLGA